MYLRCRLTRPTEFHSACVALNVGLRVGAVTSFTATMDDQPASTPLANKRRRSQQGARLSEPTISGLLGHSPRGDATLCAALAIAADQARTFAPHETSLIMIARRSPRA
jgi:hypothetical protein